MLEGVFEPIVMFLRLTNLLVAFQAIMNNFLRDMIEIGDIAVLIDDVMAGTVTEEGYNEIMEKVLMRIAKNNLFVKSEKYVWKVRKVRFLGVVIGPDEVKMEK